MLCRSAPFAGPLRCKVVNDRVRPCIADQVKIWIFVYNAYQIFLCISAVTKNDHVFLRSKDGHYLAYHGSCKFQFGFFFLPYTVSERDRKIDDPSIFPDRNAKHNADKTVSIQIIGTIVCRMVKKL